MTTTERHDLTDKRRETFDSLLDAARTLLVNEGFDGLSVRGVAAEAGVTHTTAYSFVTSKSQLIAELYLREIRRLAPLDLDAEAAAADRVAAALGGPATLFADQPAVAHAVQVALMVGDVEPEVRALRERIGAITVARLHAALPDVDDEVRDIIFAAFNGAMISAGTGYGTYDDVVVVVRRLVELIGIGGAAPAETLRERR
ncbi:MAG: TetR family transcriptional regulator [Actinobacteria bacterium]|nr:TetR family transcriptional regulator [Actinomycetota bacterium]